MPHRLLPMLFSTETGNNILTAFLIPSMGTLGLIFEIESKTWGYLCIAGAVAGKYLIDEIRYRRKERAEETKRQQSERLAEISAHRDLFTREQDRKDRESDRQQDRLDKEALARLTVQTAENLKAAVSAAGAEREARILSKVDENTEETKAARMESKAAIDAANAIKSTVADKLDAVLSIVPPLVAGFGVMDVHVVNAVSDPIPTVPHIPKSQITDNSEP